MIRAWTRHGGAVLLGPWKPLLDWRHKETGLPPPPTAVSTLRERAERATAFAVQGVKRHGFSECRPEADHGLRCDRAAACARHRYALLPARRAERSLLRRPLRPHEPH